MKQFYETYCITAECFLVWISINKSMDSLPLLDGKVIDSQLDKKVSALPTQLKKGVD